MKCKENVYLLTLENLAEIGLKMKGREKAQPDDLCSGSHAVQQPGRRRTTTHMVRNLLCLLVLLRKEGIKPYVITVELFTPPLQFEDIN